MPTDTPLRAISLLGFEAHAGNCEDYLEHVKKTVEERKNTTILAHNLHSLFLYYRSSSLRQCYDKCINMIDGMPIIWLLQLAGKKVSREDRLTYVDFIWPLLEQAQKNGWRVAHIGQSNDVQQKAIDEIKNRLTELQILGIPGYFDHSAGSIEGQRIIAQVNQFAPELLLVGLGSPLQEHWIFHHRDQLKVPAVLSCGACMEYVAGNVGTPPRWMGKAGLEWSYRLFENPSRFAGRYLVEPWGLLYSMIKFRVSGRH